MLSSSAPRRELTFAAPLTTADGIAAVDEASAGGVTARRAMVLGVALSSRPPPQLQQPKPPPLEQTYSEQTFRRDLYSFLHHIIARVNY